MNIDASNPILITRTSSAKSSWFPQARPAENDLSLGDWQPGTTSRKQRRRQGLDAFASAQKERLLELRTALVNSMNMAAQDTRADASGSSALATHNGDAGSDACDRDFALCLLAQEQNALIEIDHALQRIESGRYGICESSGQPIPISRLEAIPFARFTVERQSEMERRKKGVPERQSISPLLSIPDDEDRDEKE
jgi:RNA polymerase-binding transcription factor DksA